MAEGSHPFPFRTRPLSPPAPMVLSGRPGGRVGRCRDFFLSTHRPRVSTPRPFVFLDVRPSRAIGGPRQSSPLAGSGSLTYTPPPPKSAPTPPPPAPPAARMPPPFGPPTRSTCTPPCRYPPL